MAGDGNESIFGRVIAFFSRIFGGDNDSSEPPQKIHGFQPSKSSNNQVGDKRQTPPPVIPTASASVPEKLRALEERLKYLETLLRQGLPSECRFHEPSDSTPNATGLNISSTALFTPLDQPILKTMIDCQTEREEVALQQKIKDTEIRLNELLRRFGLLASIRNGLQYADLDRAKDHLNQAEAILQEISAIEQHPNYDRINEAIKDEVDLIGFMIDELKKTINEIEAKGPTKTKPRSLSDVQLQLKELFRDRVPEAGGILTTLEDHGIAHLYHLTDRKNIDSINFNQGIYARKTLDEMDIVPKQPGGTQQTRNVDADRHTAGYVHLYLSENVKAKEQMKARGLDPVVLKIDPTVATLKTTEFADGALTSSTTQIAGENIPSRLVFLRSCTENLKKRSWFSSEPPEAPDAVVLVETGIPKQYILNLDGIT